METERRLKRAAADVAIWGFQGGGLLLFWSLVAQAAFWLKDGIWPAWPISRFLRFAGWNLNAVYEPSDWFGAASVVRWLLAWPSSVAGAILVVAACLMIAGALHEMGEVARFRARE